MKLFTKMQLMMYLGNDFIESVDLDASKISKPGYLGKFKRNMKIKYKDLIAESKQRPDFLVVPTTTKSKANLVGNQ
ncbi:MAG TPA: hypothetical protein PKW62_09095 [Chitinophagaceae bacterium]|nr:hypothetical protein [Chitinophagaceae bacterium]